jgi:hypothetical protein
MMTGIEVSPLRGSRRRFFALGVTKSGANVGAKDYLLGVIDYNLERHEMANILGNANEARVWSRTVGSQSTSLVKIMCGNKVSHSSSV